MDLPKHVIFTAGHTTYIMETAYPNNIGQVVRINNQDSAHDYYADSQAVHKSVARVGKLNIFITWRGWLNPVHHQWQELANQEDIVARMASDYHESIVDNKIINKRYKSNW